MSSEHSLTFFAPLPEEGGSNRGSIFSSVLQFFNINQDSQQQAIKSAEDQRSQDQRSASTSSQRSTKSQSKAAEQSTGNRGNNGADDGSKEETSRARSSSQRAQSSQRSNLLPLFPAFRAMMDDENLYKRNMAASLRSPSESSSVAESTTTEGGGGQDIRRYWMPDKQCHECYDCGGRFNTFRRRHHCRICGHIFCSRCCYQQIPGRIIGHAGMVRSCKYCYDLMTTCASSTPRHSQSQIITGYNTEGAIETNQENPNADLSLLSVQSNSELATPNLSRLYMNWPESPTTEELPTFLPPQQPNELFRTSPMDVFDATNSGGHHHHVMGLNDEQLIFPLHDVWDKMCDPRIGVEFREHRFRLRKVTRTTSGTELVEWIQKQLLAKNRQQAKDICQALLNQKLIVSLNGDQIFQDDYCLYQAVAPTSDGSELPSMSSHLVTGDHHPPGSLNVAIGVGVRKSASSSGLNDMMHHHQHISIPPAPRSTSMLMENDENLLADDDPIWVQEIAYEEEDGSSSEGGIRGKRSLSGDYPSSIKGRRERGLSLLMDHASYLSNAISDEESVKSHPSTQSYTSTVEIDSEYKTIKYLRSNKNRDDDSRSDMNNGLMPRQFSDANLNEINAEYIRRFLAWNGSKLTGKWLPSNPGWYLKNIVQMPSNEKHVFHALKKLYFQHSLTFLRQLLIAESLDLGWAEIIASLVKRVADTVEIDKEVDMDICHYVHVKKLLDGCPKESQLLNGVVFTNNIIHCQMRSNIDNPFILLLATPLEYQRVQYKLSSLDQIVRQEPDFFRHLVSRIASRNPDVIISQCSVSHLARMLLLEAKITLIINVKPTVMERLARCTGADIVRSIDQLQAAKLGTCGNFHVKNHFDGKRKFNRNDGILKYKKAGDYTNTEKTLINVDGCETSHGCTILLRHKPNYLTATTTSSSEDHVIGVDREMKAQLSRVKHVLLFTLQLVYHQRLELSYLMDQQDLSTAVNSLSPNKTNNSNSGGIKSHKRSASSSSGRPLQDLKECCNNDLSEILESASAPPSVIVSTEDSDHVMCGEVFLRAFNQRLLSSSFLVKPKLPFLTTAKSENSTMVEFLNKPFYWSDDFILDMERKTVKNKVADDQTDGEEVRCSQRQEMFDVMQSRTTSHESIPTIATTTDTSLFKSTTIDNQDLISVPSTRSGTTANIYDKDEVADNKNDLSLIGSPLSEETAYEQRRQRKFTMLPSYHGDAGTLPWNDVTIANRNIVISSTDLKYYKMKREDHHQWHNWELEIFRRIFNELSNSEVIQWSSSSLNDNNKENNKPQAANKQKKKEESIADKLGWKVDVGDLLTRHLSKSPMYSTVKDAIADFRARGIAQEDSNDDVIVENVTSLNCVKDGRFRFTDAGRVGELKSSSRRNYTIVSTSSSEEHEVGTSVLDCLHPHNHQHLNILFSSYSKQSPNFPYFCVAPWVVDIDFYSNNDISLGGFLDRYCFRTNYHCNNSLCKRPMVEHVRSFVRGGIGLKLILKELSKPVPVSAVLSWCWDPKTEKSTEIKVLSEDASNMSFAKFLELRLENFATNSTWNEGESTSDAIIKKPFQLYQYFLHKNMVASFKCYQVTVNEVILPPSNIQVRPRTLWIRTKVSCSRYKQIIEESSYLSKIQYETLEQIGTILKETEKNPPNFPADDAAGSNTNTPPSGSGGNNSESPAGGATTTTATNNDNISLRQSRELCVGELFKLFDQDYNKLRKDIDEIHLLLQEIRISQQDKLLKTPLPCDSSKVDITEQIELKEDEEIQLCRLLLCLRCMIDQLVVEWNERIEHITCQDRQIRKGNKLEGNKYILKCLQIHEETDDLTDGILFKSNSKTPSLSASPNEGKNGKSFGFSPTADSKMLLEEKTKYFNRKRSTTPLDYEATVTSSSTGVVGVQFSPIPSSSVMPFIERSNSMSNSKFLKKASSTFVSVFHRSNSHVSVLPSPFPVEEHYRLSESITANILVHDDEPSSIIAYTLRSSQYKKYLVCYFGASPPHTDDDVGDDDVMMSDDDDDSSICSASPADDSLVDDDDVTAVPLMSSSPTLEDSPFHDDPASVVSAMLGESPSHNDVSVMTSAPRPSSPHLEIQFEDESAQFYCKVYFVIGFKDLRELILGDDEDRYIDSISRCLRWEAKGGKSGSNFYKSLDDRFIFKQMSKLDLLSFKKFAPSYFGYMTEALKKKQPTALSKVLGVYRITYRNLANNRTFKQDLLVMENLFYKRKIKQVYDLKGSVRNRHVKTSTYGGDDTSSIHINNSQIETNNEQETSKTVLQDENFLTNSLDRPLYIHEHTKLLITSAFTRDSQFLSRHEIIDYSLLVGIDEENQDIIIGIIDYMCAYTWEKKLENAVKSTRLLAGGKQGTRAMPTIVSPDVYKTRFLDAMSRYFQVMPDRWYQMLSGMKANTSPS